LRNQSKENRVLLTSPHVAVSEPQTTQGLFSQNNPKLYYHKSPGKLQTLPNLSNRPIGSQVQKSEEMPSEQTEMTPESKASRALTSDEMKHKLYVQPLMRFFHDCIDFERTMEINK
jgi:hypothetical protein